VIIHTPRKAPKGEAAAIGIFGTCHSGWPQGSALGNNWFLTCPLNWDHFRINTEEDSKDCHESLGPMLLFFPLLLYCVIYVLSHFHPLILVLAPSVYYSAVSNLLTHPATSHTCNIRSILVSSCLSVPFCLKSPKEQNAAIQFWGRVCSSGIHYQSLTWTPSRNSFDAQILVFSLYLLHSVQVVVCA